ncbi:MAG: hypothetical protein ACI9PN_001323 [Candidatus Azotimanducaceae bacterium]|jgi:hypothetical protein
MKNLQILACVSAISEGLIYISTFIYFGVFSSYPCSAGASPSEKMAYLAENQLIVSLVSLAMFVVFGLVLAVRVVGLHERLKHANSSTMAIGSLFGVIWVGLVIASGMISTIGLAQAVELIAKNPAKAFDIWIIVSLITEGLSGGNEIITLHTEVNFYAAGQR